MQRKRFNEGLLACLVSGGLFVAGSAAVGFVYLNGFENIIAQNSGVKNSSEISSRSYELRRDLEKYEKN